MYEYDNQQSLFDGPEYFRGVELDPENRWVVLSSLIPWADIEVKYAEAFANKRTGQRAKTARMAFASELIKKKLGLSDVELVEMITENPYLQYFIGMDEFSTKAPFDPSTLTYFRKRLTPEMTNEINEYAIHNHKKRKPPKGGSGGSGAEKSKEDKANASDKENKGTLVVDATCVPQNIKFPTDVSLLDDARKKTEQLIDVIYGKTGKVGVKPRTYRENAKKDFNRFTRSRSPRKKTIRKAIRKQLGYVRRNLDHLNDMDSGLLSDKQLWQYQLIQMLYEQQQHMYDEGIHVVEDRIVSISQPHIRPIVRGKVNADVEFGAKIATSVVDGFSRIEKLSWNAFNESETLKHSIEQYKEREGVYPERILADKIYRTRSNMDYCKKHGIKMSGPALGRPPKDKTHYREQCRKEREEAGERNCVEGSYGTVKTVYGLDNVMMKLRHSSEVDIHMSVLSMNLWKMVKEIHGQESEIEAINKIN